MTAEVDNLFLHDCGSTLRPIIVIRKFTVKRHALIWGYYKLFFPKGGAHYTDLPFRVPSSHAAPTGLLSGLRPTGLTAAWQIRTFFLPLLEKE